MILNFMLDGSIIFSEHHFPMKKRYNLWEAAEHIASYRCDYDKPFSRDKLRQLVPDKLLYKLLEEQNYQICYISYMVLRV